MYRQVVRRCLGILLLGLGLLIGLASAAVAQGTSFEVLGFDDRLAELSYTPGTGISPLILPELTGAPTITYNINSALPAELSFDSAGRGGGVRGGLQGCCFPTDFLFRQPDL